LLPLLANVLLCFVKIGSEAESGTHTDSILLS